jgi:hypothetical protein
MEKKLELELPFDELSLSSKQKEILLVWLEKQYQEYCRLGRAELSLLRKHERLGCARVYQDIYWIIDSLETVEVYSE